jgi:predicted Zn-dependent protease
MEALQDVRARGDGEAIARAAQEASDWAARALALQPWSARRGVDLADALMAANRSDEAARAYEAALAQDDRLSLDPLMQFSTRERDRVKTALARATSQGAEP